MKRISMLAAALCLTLAAPAYADHGTGKGKGGHKGHPHGMPPGQAKKIWNKGQVLPREYRAYVVRQYAAYDLYAPRQGYVWVRVDRDAYLTAVATGMILDVVRGLF